MALNTKLRSALRAKYKTPQEALKALGLDESLLAADAFSDKDDEDKKDNKANDEDKDDVEEAYEEGYEDGLEDGEEKADKADTTAGKDKKGAKDKAAKDKAAKDKAAKDAEPDDDTKKKDKAEDMVTKSAMDSALRSTAKMAEDRVITRMREAREAERFVRPWVGELAQAYDSAEEIYRAAAVTLKVPDAATIHASALKSVIAMVPKPGERNPAQTYLAGDSMEKMKGVQDEFNVMFPNARRPLVI